VDDPLESLEQKLGPVVSFKRPSFSRRSHFLKVEVGDDHLLLNGWSFGD
jgi:hypothetical protein